MMRAPFGETIVAVLLTIGTSAVGIAAENVPPLGPFAAAVQPEIVAPASRNVTPPGMTPGPEVDGPLVREEQPTVHEDLPPPPPELPRWHRFVLPVTTDAATFVTRERTVRIAGVMPLPRRTTCHRTVDGDWPCGDVALEAFRHFLLGRPVECSFMASDKSDPIVAPCRIGRIDLGAWLLGQGWVKPAENASAGYRESAETAQCAGRGLWRDDRPAACPPSKQAGVLR